MIRPARPLMMLGLLAAAHAITGCSAATQRRHAGVVDYLYPGQKPVVTEAVTPVLQLPLKVGIAFVPGPASERRFGPELGLPEAERMALLEAVGARFRQRPFVGSIEVIPSAYLTPQGGFANLDQVRSMFGVDVIALVSYDQIQFTDSRRLALTYWTLIGAYLVEGEKNDTRTLLDAAVFDIASRRLLFRAPGVSHVRGTAAPVNVNEERRKDASEGFRLAATDLTTNLEAQLDRFTQRVRSADSDVRIVQQPGAPSGTSGGSGDLYLLAAAGLLAAGAVAAGRRRAR